MIAPVPVLIVGFRNAGDVVRCLGALARLKPPAIEVFICENGGPSGFDALCAALTGDDGPCLADPAGTAPAAPRLARVAHAVLRDGNHARVHVGEATENLGYAGGINAWLVPLLGVPGWPALWVLNPDTEPSPEALGALAGYAARYGRGMVGSRLYPRGRPDLVHLRGLIWRPRLAQTVAVGLHAAAVPGPPPGALDASLDAPSGASMYVTRACVERIGPMDERYFLYCEDLDWGLRAKRAGGIGYADDSAVAHEGGTTIGSSTSRRHQSRLAVYLEFRNRLLFVHSHFIRWYPWTLLVQFLHLALYLRAPAQARAALRGIADGLAGRTGRPDHVMRAHRPGP